MSIYEKLIEEFGCAITAVFGDKADEEYNEDNFHYSELVAICKKVEFYLDM